MRMIIEIVTAWSTYSNFTWTKEDQKNYGTHPDYQSDDQMELLKQVTQIRNSKDYDEKESIAYDIVVGGSYGDYMMVEPYFSSIEVFYPDGEQNAENIRPDEEISNDWKGLDDFYADKIADPENLVVITRADHMKRGLWKGNIETDKEFNINYLSMSDGEITYGTQTIEYADGGEGYDSEMNIYCDTDGDED